MSGVLNCQQAPRHNRSHTQHTQVTELIVELDNERKAHMLLLAYGGYSGTTATAYTTRHDAVGGWGGGGGVKKSLFEIYKMVNAIPGPQQG